MMAGIEPAVVGMAEAVEGADIDHATEMGRRWDGSSVSDVTARCAGFQQLLTTGS
jgi:hypothetical protein